MKDNDTLADDLQDQIRELRAELMHVRKFCHECGGSGKVSSWNVSSGPPLVQCQCRQFTNPEPKS